MTLPLYADTVVYYLAMVASVCLWCRYVAVYLDIRGWGRRLLKWSGWALVIYQVVALALNFFTGWFFSFNAQNAYVAGPLRHVAHSLLIVFNFLCALFALAKVLRTRGDSGLLRRHLTVFVFCMSLCWRRSGTNNGPGGGGGVWHYAVAEIPDA